MPSRDGKRGTQPAENWCRIEAKADDDQADVYIYGRIGGGLFGGGVSAKDFAEQIGGITAKTLNVYINSPGGSVFDGLAILNAIRRHPATVNVTVDGIAASAASFIAQAGDTLTMSRNSQMMIHDALGMIDIFGMANPADIDTYIAELEAFKENLDRQSDNIAAVYAEASAARGGLDSPAAWRALMTAETWYFAEEAVAAGLADKVDDDGEDDKGDTEDVAPVELRFRYSGREEAPPPSSVAAVAAAPETPPEPPAETPDESAHDLEKIRNQIKKEAAL